MKRLLFFAFVVVLGSCKSDKEGNTEGEGYSASPTEQNSNRSPELDQSIKRGAKVYNNFCATCHLGSGEGIPNAFPPLNNSDWLTEKREESIHAVKFGLRGPIEVNGEPYNSLMTDPGLTDEEVADVMNYILTAWDNNIQEPVTVEEVAAIKK